jgi:ankyrin repeat protein
MFLVKCAATLVFPVVLAAYQPAPMKPFPDAKAAAAKAVALIQDVGAHWKQACASCHNQFLPLLTFQRAREHGVPVNEQLATRMLRQSFPNFRSDYAIQGWNPEATYENAFTLVAAYDSGVPASDTAAAYVRLFMRRQMPDGRWLLDDDRPPESFSEITSTALVMRAVQLYSSPRMNMESGATVERARSWLEAHAPRETEEGVFRLLGLAWAKSDPVTLTRSVHQLLAEQKKDGGWSQMPHMVSDAYATGEVLVALHEAGGLPASHPAYQAGVQFLLRTQHQDGSWLVNTRMHVPGVSPPYFESGFPYGHSQFISCAATNWAAMALALSLPAVKPRMDVIGDRESILNERLEPWAETILFGSTQELQTLPAGGFDPNRATELGTTALMMAAPDPEKVKLLLAAGADPNAKAKSRFTALMVASAYRGGKETVQMLLDRGADAEPHDPPPTFYVSAAYLAAGAGDAETLQLLLDKGANPHRQVIQFWFFPEDTILMPLLMHENSTLRSLPPHFNKRELNEGLTIAVIDNHCATVRELLSGGADVNYIDKFGMTALQYAASTGYGEPDMVELLLHSGADSKLRTNDGLTALALAKKYGNTDIERVLERAGAVE